MPTRLVPVHDGTHDAATAKTGTSPVGTPSLQSNRTGHTEVYPLRLHCAPVFVVPRSRAAWATSPGGTPDAQEAAVLAFAPLILIATASPAPAPSPSPSPSPSPFDALIADALIADAWAHSPEVARAAADVAAAEASMQTLAVILPNPELAVGVNSDVVFARQGELDAEVALVQELAWPGARLAKQDGAARARESARLKLALARLDVAARVEQGVGAVIAARDAARVRGDIATGARSLADAARRRVEAGAAGPLEETLARSDHALAEAALADAQAALATEVAALCALVARDRCEPAFAEQIAPPTLSALPAAPPSPTIDLTARADVRAAALDVEAAERRVDGAELERIPSARLGIGYRFDQGVFDSPALTENVVDPDHLAGVTLAVTLPIWDWKTGEVAQARADAARADAELRAVRRTATTSVARALARFRAASTSAERLAATEADVARALTDVQNAYVAGALPLDEALTTRDRLLRTRLELIDAKRRQVEAHADALVALANPALLGIEVEP